MDEIICECRHKYESHGLVAGCSEFGCSCELRESEVLKSHITALRSLLSDAMKALGWAMNVIENEVEVTDRTEHDFATDTSARIKATQTGGE